MGIKGEEVGRGFPQPKPAFITLVCYMPMHNLILIWTILCFWLINQLIMCCLTDSLVWLGPRRRTHTWYATQLPHALLVWHWLNPISCSMTDHKNHLTYIKFQGSIKSVQGSGLPHLEGVVVDGEAWGQEVHLPSGEAWVKGGTTALFRSHPTDSNSLHFWTYTHLGICFFVQSYWTTRFCCRLWNRNRGGSIKCVIIARLLNVLINS